MSKFIYRFLKHLGLFLFYHEKVSAKCAAHVQRVMHQRAVDVHLMPEIQMACVKDLGQHCKDQLGKGEVQPEQYCNFSLF